MKANGQRWFLGAGIVSAIAASLCCIGPAIMLALGLGGFAAASWFAEYRPWFLGLTGILLGAAWWLALRSNRACAVDGACQPGSPRRRNTFIMLTIATVAALGFTAYPWIAEYQAAADTAKAEKQNTLPSEGARKVSYSIPSMDCAACATGIAKILREKPGVLSATVSYDSKTAEITYDPSLTSPESLAAAIAETGFPPERPKTSGLDS